MFKKISKAGVACLASGLLALCLAATPLIGHAAESTSLNAKFMGTSVTPSSYAVRLAMAEPLGNSPSKAKFQQAVISNMGFLPFVTMVDSASVPGGVKLPVASGPELDFARFRMTRADNLITSSWTTAQQVEMRAYDVGEGKFLFGTRLDLSKGTPVEDLADEFCAQFMEHMTGRGDFFRAKLAFVKSANREKQDIWSVKPNGRQLHRITNVPGSAISPAWSQDSRFIIFTHIDDTSHALGVWDSKNNSVQRIRFPGNTVIGPCFMPDNKVAVSLTDGQSPSIFLLNRSFKKEKRLVSSWSIDVSPSVDDSGSKLVYTSSRLGNPHIFLDDLKTGTTKRVTTTGKYNTEPSISPDGTMVAFSRMATGGHRIFVHDLRTGKEQQVSFGPGSDEQPEFAPDSYFIAFSSTRSGTSKIYLTTRHGGEAKMVPTGNSDASFPTWNHPGK